MDRPSKEGTLFYSNSAPDKKKMSWKKRRVKVVDGAMFIYKEKKTTADHHHTLNCSPVLAQINRENLIVLHFAERKKDCSLKAEDPTTIQGWFDVIEANCSAMGSGEMTRRNTTSILKSISFGSKKKKSQLSELDFNSEALLTTNDRSGLKASKGSPIANSRSALHSSPEQKDVFERTRAQTTVDAKRKISSIDDLKNLKEPLKEPQKELQKELQKGPEPQKAEVKEKETVDFFKTFSTNASEKYHLEDKVLISTGRSGDLYSSINNDGRQVCLRIASKTVSEEIRLLTRSSHKNIVSILDLYAVDESIWIYSEWMSQGSLADLLEVRDQFELKEIHFAYILFEILSAINFIHSLKKVHKNIKTDKVLLDSFGNVKLSDFGNLQSKKPIFNCHETVYGTIPWLSPELCLADFRDGVCKVTTRTDIWSFGVILFEIIERRLPYEDEPYVRVPFLLATCGLPKLSESKEKYSSNMIELFHLCTSLFEMKEARDLLRHSFFKAKCNRDDFLSLLTK